MIGSETSKEAKLLTFLNSREVEPTRETKGIASIFGINHYVRGDEKKWDYPDSEFAQLGKRAYRFSGMYAKKEFSIKVSAYSRQEAIFSFEKRYKHYAWLRCVEIPSSK